MNRPGPRLTAVLGPTNTGKTHLAIERMLGHGSGMMGFPLRLLARENYDRVCGLVGRDKAALVTGEEKIVPPGARYFLCTVESMPLDRRVDFLGIDEIQLAADPDRGHIFTDRLLHARGLEETMLLGADTIRPLLRKLAPEAAHIARPRFSTLTHTGPRKLSRLPPRSAVVAFSVADVYELAELMRRQRGGVAVVMGALSPRTRNAQVQMFQSGQVDFMVATDAIGMGLNMDLDHVAFARLTKFDGHVPRKLKAAEIAQIAGRAGRHMNDGTFGTTEGAPPLDPEIVEAVEAHRFDPLSALFWRNTDLDFRSGEALLRSLESRTPHPGLIRVREADDHMSLAALWRDTEIRDLAKGRDAVSLLWEVCQVPDFRKILSDAHTRLLGQIYRYLRTEPDRRLPTDWVAEQIERLDRPAGDIDTLMQRLAHIRTWTYVANRGDWLADAAAWQERTRDVEDRLSDALHAALTQRFVDERHAHLARRMVSGGRLEGSINASDEVVVEGHLVGRLEGFRFRPDGDVRNEDTRKLMTAARHALETAIPERVRALEQDPDSSFALLPNCALEWRGQTIARLVSGDHPLRPRIEVGEGEFLDGPLRERIRRRLALWFEVHRDRVLGSLIALEAAPLQGAARGLAYQLSEALGTLSRAAIRDQLGALSKADRRALAELGVQLGRASVWVRPVQNASAAKLAQMLLALYRGRATPPAPPRRPLSFVPHADDDAAAVQAAGYRLAGSLAVRVDALERLANATAKLGEQGPFGITDALAATIDATPETLAPVLHGLGYRRHGSGVEATFEWRGRRRNRRPTNAISAPIAAAGSGTPTPAQDVTAAHLAAPDAAPAAADAADPAVAADASPADPSPDPAGTGAIKRRRRRRRRRARAPESVSPIATSSSDAEPGEATDAAAACLAPHTGAMPAAALDGADSVAPERKKRRRRRRRKANLASMQAAAADSGSDATQPAASPPSSSTPSSPSSPPPDEVPRRRRRRRSRGRKDEDGRHDDKARDQKHAGRPASERPAKDRSKDGPKTDRPHRTPRHEAPRRRPTVPSPDSPFAILATIDWTRRS